MLNRIIQLIVVSLFIFLTGCSTTTYFGHNTGRHYSQVVNLPADYPTKYLPDGNIWDEIAGNLKFSDNTNLPHVREQIHWFQQHQDFLNRAIERGAPYIYYIYQETKRRNLPAELVLIPIFESGYNACSRSYASAVGFWQFMPKTAKGFNLKMNRWYDGRCDAVASTNAALKYFTYLHYFFNNDWFLAISAYDAGPGRIQAAILHNQRRGVSTNFWDLDVKQETIVYVPKLLALSAIIHNPEHYGVQLLSINNGPYFEQVEISSQMDLSKVAKLANTDIDTIKRLNPAFKRGVTDPEGPHYLLIPKSKVEIFKANLSGISYTVSETITPVTTAPAAASAFTLTSLHKHIVKRGETLTKIAHQYHTTTKVLRKINGLKNNVVKLGQILSVAIQGKESVNETVVEKSVTTTPKNSTIPYKTAGGDNIYRVAQHFHTTSEKIRAVNHLTSNAIKVGQILQIPIVTTSPAMSVKASTKSKVLTSKLSTKTKHKIAPAVNKNSRSAKFKVTRKKRNK